VPRPAKELKGYEKIFLKKGEQKRVEVMLTDEAFRFYDIFSCIGFRAHSCCCTVCSI